MVMKQAFLLCGSVILLSLFTERAGAQIDSNSIVRLHCDSISSGCTMEDTVTTILEPWDSIISKYTTPDGGSLRVGIDGSFPLSARSHTGLSNWWLDIDSINNLIINLTLVNGDYHYSQFGPGGVDGGDNIEVQFSPIPFTRTGNIISVSPGLYPCKYDFGAIRQGATPTGSEVTQWNGSCNDSGSTMDSVYLEIYPASAEVLTVPDLNIPLHVTSNGVNEMFSFNSSSIGRNLEVMDMLGRIVFSTSLAPSETWHEVPLEQLPPGCYFARLGDQVAKFVVPPR